MQSRPKREIVAKYIPTSTKSSQIVSTFETFGDIIKLTLDEHRRRTNTTMHVFITFAEAINASRAVEAEFVYIKGQKITIEYDDGRRPSGKKRDHGSANNFNEKRDGKSPPRVQKRLNSAIFRR